MKLNIVLRTCDRHSLQSQRIVNKKQCILTCVNSLVQSARISGFCHEIHIIDDASSESTRSQLKALVPEASFEFLSEPDEEFSDPRARSRVSVKAAYDYINQLPAGELVYIVEDDYLHYENSIELIVKSWQYFTNFLSSQGIRHVGIFPQDFNQLYLHSKNPFPETYVTTCQVLPGPDRYFRTTWYTHESFVVTTDLIKEYQGIFQKLLLIGSDPGYWEGNTISEVWKSPGVAMLMPLGTLAVHLGNHADISFFADDWKTLWNKNFIPPINT